MKLRKSRKITCRYCQGQGWVQDSFDDMFGYVGSFEAMCEDCDGKGHVHVDKKHCIDCNDKFYGEKHVKRCDECDYMHTLKECEKSLQDDKFGFLP